MRKDHDLNLYLSMYFFFFFFSLSKLWTLGRCLFTFIFTVNTSFPQQPKLQIRHDPMYMGHVLTQT